MIPESGTPKQTTKLEAIQKQTPVFKIMADNSLDAILLIDLTPETLYANRAAHELFGYNYATQELVGQSGFIYWVEADLPLFNETILPQVLAGGWNGEVRQQRKDGTIFDTWAVASPTYADEDQLVGISVTLRDITERKLAEKALHESDERFHAITDTVLDGIIVMDNQGRICLWNKAAERIMGYSWEQAQGRDLHELIAPAQYNAANSTRLPRFWATGESEVLGQILELTVIRQDGTEMPIELSVSAFQWHNQWQAVGVIRDISERKQAETERERLQKEIIEAQQRAIAELSTPVIPIMDRIIVMPLIGSIDSLRARDITRTLLAGIQQHRAKVVILDVTGVGIMDTGIVNHLNKTIQAARLKGAQTIVTGMSDAVAEAIVDLGIDWSNIQTLADLQTGLIIALDSLGVRLTK